MSTSTKTDIVILRDPTVAFTFTAPPLALYNIDNYTVSRGSTQKVINQLATTVMWNYDEKSPSPVAPSYIKVIFTFELLSALLDTAPSGSSNNLFLMSVALPSEVQGLYKYVVDAQIQTIGNSTMSPTYVTYTQDYTTDPSVSTKNRAFIVFPVTNFFNVTAPGAPYTITLTLQLDK